MQLVSCDELLVKINAPEFCTDQEFVMWLNDPQGSRATWHKVGEQPNEYSDIFFTFDGGEGSASDMPEHIWELLCDLIQEEFGANVYCLVWLTNLPE